LGYIIGSPLSGGGYCFTLDLREVPRLDDLGAGAIKMVAARLPRRGASFQIANAWGSVRDAIRKASASRENAEEQRNDVDAISGATTRSKALMTATENALAKGQ
jgi:MFS superfamily sulfate permease-like transporter